MDKLQYLINTEGSDLLGELESLVNKDEVLDFFSAYLSQINHISFKLSQSDQAAVKQMFSVRLAGLFSDGYIAPHYPDIVLDTDIQSNVYAEFVLINLKYIRSLLNYYISQGFSPDKAVSMAVSVNTLLDRDLLLISKIYGER